MAKQPTALLGTSAVARRLGVSDERVRQWAAAGSLPIAAIADGRDRLFDAAAVEAFRRVREQQAAAKSKAS
jgi:excisionase family DNA binding protein